MKHTEFFEAYWDGRSEPKQESLLADQPVEFRVAWNVFQELNGRSGFDHWWDGDVDTETQDECFASVVEVIKKSFGETP